MGLVLHFGGARPLASLSLEFLRPVIPLVIRRGNELGKQKEREIAKGKIADIFAGTYMDKLRARKRKRKRITTRDNMVMSFTHEGQ